MASRNRKWNEWERTEFTTRGSDPTVVVTWTYRYKDGDGTTRTVAIEDSGPGLAEEDREHAFERFYLHERYGRERPVGTGLGLAIVKELTHAMGGSVSVESRAGALTVFTVKLGVPL